MYAWFKQLTGMLLHELITKQRMTTAELYIKTTSLKLDKIAELVGYSSYSDFYTVF